VYLLRRGSPLTSQRPIQDLEEFGDVRKKPNRAVGSRLRTDPPIRQGPTGPGCYPQTCGYAHITQPVVQGSVRDVDRSGSVLRRRGSLWNRTSVGVFAACPLKAIGWIGGESEEQKSWIVIRRHTAVHEHERLRQVILVPLDDLRREEHGRGRAGPDELAQRNAQVAVFSSGLVVASFRI